MPFSVKRLIINGQTLCFKIHLNGDINAPVKGIKILFKVYKPEQVKICTVP